ncbi:type IV secretory system conjugative DNA transfer family protein [Kribbella amoyensis]|uniref:type IV secretory system conjugative DNA transfer family protein n=1 Tax=Kribbella amoyensis TaxID=996641 RepID=UPI0014788829|nr:TraM recognition domain-containing protein [Kribbella amoyensis]
MLPKLTMMMTVALAAGVALTALAPSPVAAEVGVWLAVGGALGLVSVGLMFWQVGRGLVAATWLWLGYAGVLATRIGAPGGAGSWLVTAAALVLVSTVLIRVNQPVGAGISAGAWLVYAGLLLRVLPVDAQVSGWWWAAVTLGALAVLGTMARIVFSRSSSRGLLRRLGRAGRVTDGLASSVDVYRAASARTLRKKTTQLRPSLAGEPLWRRRFVPLTDLGVKVGRVGFVSVWSSVQDHTITFGGPRKGKTQLLMNWVLDAPGAVITTSTKQDVVRDTATARAAAGPVWVFDPSGVITDGSEVDELVTDLGGAWVRFDPLRGCENAAVAMDRAADLVDGVGRNKSDGQGERWDGFAKQTLHSLLHAAALGGYSMYDVQQWVAHPSKDAADRVLYELEAAGSTAAGMMQEAKQFFTNNPNTQSSISTTIMPALSWLSVETAARSAAPGGQQFDVAELLAAGGTVYLIGAEDKKTAPLVTALTAHIARQAKAIAARSRRERLDPSLTMVLDEAALICLIPLDQWSGDFGSRGITMHIAAQSRAQMRQRFGDAATGALLTNCATKILFGGSADGEDLQYWSTVAGERDEPAVTKDRSTGAESISTRKSTVLTPAQVGQLRTGQVLIITNGMPPAITTARLAYKRLDVRLARFRRRPAVSWTITRAAAVSDATGGWLLGQAGWVRAQVLAADRAVSDRTSSAVRRAIAPAVRRASAFLAWLDANDPARELLARVRLIGAMRKARASLAARQQRPVDREVHR